jgi:hypothetical protein
MQRRDVLRSATAIVAASTAGLAGCSGGNERERATPTPVDPGDTSACRPPSGALTAALPQSDSYDRVGDVTTTDGSHDDGVERTAYTLYSGPDGEEYYSSVTEFSSAAAADEGTERQRAQGGHDNGTLGLVQFDQYVYFAAGPDQEVVRDLLAQSSLSEDCLAGTFRVLTGTATPEPL